MREGYSPRRPASNSNNPDRRAVDCNHAVNGLRGHASRRQPTLSCGIRNGIRLLAALCLRGIAFFFCSPRGRERGGDSKEKCACESEERERRLEHGDANDGERERGGPHACPSPTGFIHLSGEGRAWTSRNDGAYRCPTADMTWENVSFSQFNVRHKGMHKH